VKTFAGRIPTLSRRYRRLSCHVRCRQCKRLPENMVSLEHNKCQHCPALAGATLPRRDCRRSLNVPSLRTRPVALSRCSVPQTRLNDKWYRHRANNEQSLVSRRQASGTIIHTNETVPRSYDTKQKRRQLGTDHVRLEMEGSSGFNGTEQSNRRWCSSRGWAWLACPGDAALRVNIPCYSLCLGKDVTREESTRILI
jgi:hypothetical protein